MKEYLCININNWAGGDYGFDVLYGNYAPDRYMQADEDNLFSIQKDITVNQNEKFFFLPGVTIPRIKLKDLYAQTKSKTVREVTEATKIIIGRKTTNALTDHAWKYWIKTEALKTLLTDTENALDTNSYNDMMTLLEVYKEDIVLGNYDLKQLCDSAEAAGVITFDDYSRNSKSFFQLEPDYIELFKSLNNVIVYDEIALISLINGDESSIIDEAMYESLKDMFKSRDKDNRVLAMEIMANSNYKESLMYLCFLFKAYSHIISDEKSRNHVNFKSLINYMGFDSPTYCEMTIDSAVELLMREDAFTKKNAIRVLAEFKDEISERGETYHLKVSKITFGQHVMNYLQKTQTLQHESEHTE